MKHFFVLILPMILYVTACSSPVSTGDEDLPTTTISFALQEASHTTLWLENSYKTTVLTITDQLYEAGSHSITFEMADRNGNSFPKGIYSYHIKTNHFSQSRFLIYNP